MLRFRRYQYTPNHWAIASRRLWFMLDASKRVGYRHWKLKVGHLRIEWR